MNKQEIFLKIFLITGILLKLVSSDDFTCYNCNSTKPECTTLEKKIENATKCEGKKCYTITLGNNQNKRGCITDLTDDNQKKICKTKNEKCHTCEASNCNDKPFPDDRPKCYQCNGDSCNKTSDLTEKYCMSYNENKCFTYFNGTYMARGCVDAELTDYKICKENDQYCKICTGTKDEICNNHKMELKCFECNSSTGNCKRPEKYPDGENNCNITGIRTKICSPKMFNGSPSLCYTFVDRYDIVSRGCFSDFENTTIGQLNPCQGDECNKACIKDVSCIQCDSKNDSNCSSLEPEINPEWNKTCSDPYISVCHRCEDSDGRTVRGCGRSPMITSNCNFCYNDSCKANPTLRQCYKCNETDLNCSNGGSESKIRVGNCKNTRNCFVGITKDGLTQRNCEPENKDWHKEYLEHKICNDRNLCNSNLLPANRTLCFQCNEKTDSWCNAPTLAGENKNEAKGCYKYDKNDLCYLYADKDKSMIRGCLSDDPEKNENRKGCNDSNNNCVKCKGNKCNISPYERHSLKCIKCDETDKKCSLGYDKMDAKDCQPTPYYTNETCFTHIDNNKINRGCTLDSDSEKFKCLDSSNKKCQICIGDGCNQIKIEHQKCIRCRSDAIPVCAEENVIKMEPVVCKDEKHTDNSGCYTQRYKNLVSRSCVSELTEQDIKECKKSDYCNFCEGNGCNNKKVPNSAIGIERFSSLLLIVIGFFSI